MATKTIKKSTLRELTRLTREYARTGDVEVLPVRIKLAKELATQAYGKDSEWLAFEEFVGAILGASPLKPNCTDEELEELFRWLGFEIEEGEDGKRIDREAFF